MLESLFAPQSVALLGASATEGKVGHALAKNLVETGYQGGLVFVNPKANEILGVRCYHSLRDYPRKVEMAIVATPVPSVKQAVRDALDSGAATVIVVTAGFKETGPEGAAAERELAEMCAAAGARLLGPNCLGVINTHTKLNASFAHRMPVPGHISVVSQSGALIAALLDWMTERQQGLAKMVSVGNKADLTEDDLFDVLADDDDTYVIAGYLESISAGPEFVRVAESVTKRKPVIVLKGGTSEAGAKAAASHTGSLAGADIAYMAAFRRAGVIRAETFEALLDYAIAFAMEPLPKGRNVAVITNAGGPGIMAADALEAAGLKLAPLAGATTAALRQRLPKAASVGNPIDVLGDADPERYAEAVRHADEDETVDVILVLLTPQAMTLPAATAHAICAAAKGEKPMLAAFMGGQEVMPGRTELVSRGLPDYPSPERAVAAIKAMVDYAEWLRRPARVVTRFPVNRQRAQRIIARHERMKRAYIGEAAAKEILAAYDFEVPQGGLATTAEEATAIAERIGFPVAMKIASPDIVHKSDVGGVRINLHTQQEVVDSFDLMMLRTPHRVPGARIDGAYVEQMVPREREVILGMTRDPQFGPLLMFGLGGIFVEVLKDVTFRLAPLTHQEAVEMLRGTRAFPLLIGVRGQEAVDIDAIADGIQRISQLVTDFPQIKELDINPYLVGAIGTMPIAADARIILDLRQ